LKSSQRLPLVPNSDILGDPIEGNAMGTNVKLSDEFVAEVRRIAKMEHRSVPKQIEFYFRIAKIGEENPELSFDLVKQILVADAEPNAKEYTFE